MLRTERKAILEEQAKVDAETRRQEKLREELLKEIAEGDRYSYQEEQARKARRAYPQPPGRVLQEQERQAMKDQLLREIAMRKAIEKANAEP